MNPCSEFKIIQMEVTDIKVIHTLSDNHHGIIEKLLKSGKSIPKVLLPILEHFSNRVFAKKFEY